MFRPLLGHLQPSGETDPRAIYISMHCGIPNALRLCYMNVKYVSLYILKYVFQYIQTYVFHIHITQSESIWDPTMH